jgi:hypothetical protein
MAVAAQTYPRRAQDLKLINHATEIRKRSERQTGERLAEMKQQGERDAGKDGDSSQWHPALYDGTNPIEPYLGDPT